MKVKFGVHIGVEKDNTLRSLSSFSKEIERLGFDGIFVSDSLSSGYDPLLLLSCLAPLTETISLGTCVYILPLRHPIHAAIHTAFLNRISDGRLIFGIGVGWRESEFRDLNLDFHKRGIITDESIKIVKMAWEKGMISFKGRYFDIDKIDIGTSVKPLPAIWIGGNSRKAMRRAAKYGDGWIPTDFSIEDYKESIPILRKHLSDEGRSISEFTVASHLILALAKDAESIAKRFNEDLESFDKWALVGESDRIIERISRYYELGVRYHVLSVWYLRNRHHAMRILKTFAREVLPSL